MPNRRRWFYLLALAVFTVVSLQYFFDVAFSGRASRPPPPVVPAGGARPDFVGGYNYNTLAGGDGAVTVTKTKEWAVEGTSGGGASSTGRASASETGRGGAMGVVTATATGTTTTTPPTRPSPSTSPLRWTKLPEKYPPGTLHPLPSPPATNQIPKIQHAFPPEPPAAKQTRLARQKAVQDVFQKSWTAYKTHAWLHDELLPLSRGHADPLLGWAATLIDSLDTLHLLNLTADFEAAVAAVAEIDFWSPGRGGAEKVPLFEVNIRYLGGLLGAYDVSGGRYAVLLDKAVQLGELLLAAFDTPNRMPVTWFPWREALLPNGSADGGAAHRPAATTLLSELGTLSLEFTRLAQLTGEAKFWDAVERVGVVMEVHQNETLLPGMWPIFLDAEKLDFRDGGKKAGEERAGEFTLGGMSDSAYEYLVKTHLLLSGAVPRYKSMYLTALPVLESHIFFRPLTPQNHSILLSGLTSVKVLPPTKGSNITNTTTTLHPQGQHLACFAGGMLALASRLFNRPGDLRTAEQLVEGCVWAYNATETGLMPETFWAVPCANQSRTADADDCPWDEQAWLDAVFAFHRVDFPEGVAAGEGAGHNGTAARAHRHELARSKVKANHLPRGFAGVRDRGYFLRPEAVESLFVLYRVTGEQRWADYAWTIFERVVKLAETPGGAGGAFSGVEDVMVGPAGKEGKDGKKEAGVKLIDRMESFWLAETVKYFWLVFAEPDVLSLDAWVFNTEAHALRRVGGGGG